MPVTTTYPAPQSANFGLESNTIPAETSSENHSRSYQHTETPNELAYKSTSRHRPQKDFLQSSFTDHYPYDTEYEPRAIQASANGFMYACINAYFDHKHLILRPDDIWLAILTQLNMYIKANSEKLRPHFVAHSGKKELVIEIRGKTGDEKNPLMFANFVQDMTYKMQENIVDPELREWVMPAFSTTTELDRVVASITFMGAMGNYFSYGGVTGCGIPSVRLEGARSDWVTMLNKIEKLQILGPEAISWYTLLHPIMTSFIETFDSPGAKSTENFWQRILHHESGGSGQPNHFSGWLTAFSFWGAEGECLFKNGMPNLKKTDRHLTLKGVVYPRIRISKIVKGWVSVPVVIDDRSSRNGKYNVELIAGAMAIQHESSEDVAGRLDTIAPMQGWFVYFTSNIEDGCEPEVFKGPKDKKKGAAGGKICRIDFQEKRRAMWAEMEM